MEKRTCNITQGFYTFEELGGLKAPELEMHVDGSATGYSTFSLVIHPDQDIIGLNVQNAFQGASSISFNAEKAEEFFTRALAMIQEKRNVKAQ